MTPRALLLLLLAWPLAAQEADTTALRQTLEALVRQADAATGDPVRQAALLTDAARRYVDLDLPQAVTLLTRAARLVARPEVTGDYAFSSTLRAIAVRDLPAAMAIWRLARADRRETVTISADTILSELAVRDLPAALAWARAWLADPDGLSSIVGLAASHLLWDNQIAAAAALAELAGPEYGGEVLVRAVVQLLPDDPPAAMALADRQSDRVATLRWGLWHAGQASWHRDQPPRLAEVGPRLGDSPSADIVRAALARFVSSEVALPVLRHLSDPEARCLGLSYHLTEGGAAAGEDAAAALVAELLPSLPLRYQRLYAHHQLGVWWRPRDRARAAREFTAALELLLAIPPAKWSDEPMRGPAAMTATYEELVGLLVRQLARTDGAAAERLRPSWARLVGTTGNELVAVACDRAERDLPGAIALLRRGTPRDQLDQRLSLLATWLAADRLDDALTVTRWIADPALRDTALAAVAGEAAGRDLTAAAAVARRIADPVIAGVAGLALVESAIEAPDLPRAEALAGGLTERLARSDALVLVVRALIAARQLEEAVRVASTIPADGPRSDALNLVAAELRSTNQRERAIAVALRIPDYQQRVQCLTDSLQELADRPAEAVALIAREPSEQARQDLITEFATALAAKDIDAALKLANDIPHPPLRDAVRAVAVQRLAASDLDRARALLAEIRSELPWAQAMRAVLPALCLADRPPEQVLADLPRLSWGFGFDWRGNPDQPTVAEALAGWLQRLPPETWEAPVRKLLPQRTEQANDHRFISLWAWRDVITAATGRDLALARRLAGQLDEADRVWPLREIIAQAMPAHPEEALAAARSVTDPQRRAWLLLEVAARLGGGVRRPVLTEVDRLALRVRDLAARASLQRRAADLR